MARSDLLLALVRSGAEGDRALFRKTAEALIAEERAQQHGVLADNLTRCLNGSNGSPRAVNGTEIPDLLLEISPRRTVAELTLKPDVLGACRELIEEQNRAELLRSQGLEPRHRVLLIGSPGNGKTSLAEALAEGLVVPLLAVRYESLIGSFLGETASRLRRIFDCVRTRRCVLFFDEFDTVGKERGDTHETGEIKRVVSSLLLQIDDLPTHVIVVAATNHPELLDRAVWRRFQIRMKLEPPGAPGIRQWIEAFSQRSGLDLRHKPETIARRLAGLSFAELEEFTTDLLRRLALAGPDADVRSIVQSRLTQWEHRTAAGRLVDDSLPED